MQDKFTEFCNNDAVCDALCDILTHHVNRWFHLSRHVTSGIDKTCIAQQRTRIEGARVLGMMDLVCSITGLTPEDIVQLNPEKYRALILYVVNYK